MSSSEKLLPVRVVHEKHPLTDPPVQHVSCPGEKNYSPDERIEVLALPGVEKLAGSLRSES